MAWDQIGWNDLARQANDFLNTGVSNDAVIDGQSGLASPSVDGCSRSDQCGSGFACVNGECVQVSGGYSSGGNTSGNLSSPTTAPNSATGCDPDNPDSVCGSATGATNCQVPGCDNDNKIPDKADCCGERCCRFSGAGVQCFCGPCPPPSGCSAFCTDYFAANGTNAAGCSNQKGVGNVCDECQYCDVINFDGQCMPKTGITTPCWCDSGEGCGDCEKCDTDPASFTYAKCVSAPGECQSCATKYNHKCPCGTIIPEKTVCKNAAAGGLPVSGLLDFELREECDKICETDPCKGTCTSAWYPEDSIPTCPRGASCTEIDSSFIFVDGEGTRIKLIQTCDKLNVPDECKFADCSCHNECAYCEQCVDGTCVPDPQCACSDSRFENGLGIYRITYLYCDNQVDLYDCRDGGFQGNAFGREPGCEERVFSMLNVGSFDANVRGARVEVGGTSAYNLVCGPVFNRNTVDYTAFTIYALLSGGWQVVESFDLSNGTLENTFEFLPGTRNAYYQLVGIEFTPYGVNPDWTGGSSEPLYIPTGDARPADLTDCGSDPAP